MIPTLLGIMVVNFAIVQTAPGGPVDVMIARIRGVGAEATARVMAATKCGLPRWAKLSPNVPDIVDVECMSDLLRSMGMTVTRPAAHDLVIDRPAEITPEAPERDVKTHSVFGPKNVDP